MRTHSTSSASELCQLSTSRRGRCLPSGRASDARASGAGVFKSLLLTVPQRGPERLTARFVREWSRCVPLDLQRGKRPWKPSVADHAAVLLEGDRSRKRRKVARCDHAPTTPQRYAERQTRRRGDPPAYIGRTTIRGRIRFRDPQTLPLPTFSKKEPRI